eukprot:2221730-Pyramimonas_sp.AAC.1
MGMAIDTISWNFTIQDHMKPESTRSPPENGCYIWGLYIEGARWDGDAHAVGESRPKELFTEFPMMWLDPVQHRKAPETVRIITTKYVSQELTGRLYCIYLPMSPR